jgi:class 3 adenylate cyclase
VVCPSTGTLTLLFSAIEGSTRWLQRLSDRYAQLVAEHRERLGAAFRQRHGHEIDTAGDGFLMACSCATQAVAVQRAMAAQARPDAVSFHGTSRGRRHGTGCDAAQALRSQARQRGRSAGVGAPPHALGSMTTRKRLTPLLAGA